MTRKCVVWDLDDTVWDGVSLEGEVRPRPVVREVLARLDERGILHSIASRGEEEVAISALRRHGLEHLFLAPRINWDPKPNNILSIAEELGLTTDSFVFVDNDPFERAQVGWMIPEVLTVDARDAGRLPSMPELSADEITPESARRRALYQAEAERREAASSYPSRRAFLDSCEMRLVVRPLGGSDVPRVLELMHRTHQLNTTGIVFSREAIVQSSDDIHVADLSDRFGDYGTVGVAIAERREAWTLTYLALSCRVMGRGVERGLLAAVLAMARDAGYGRAEAHVRDTGRNRSMPLLYRFSGLDEVEKAADGTRVFRVDVDDLPPPPPWLELR